jgi:hypothetical protein
MRDVQGGRLASGNNPPVRIVAISLIEGISDYIAGIIWKRNAHLSRPIAGLLTAREVISTRSCRFRSGV